jgi:hypothetical protein
MRNATKIGIGIGAVTLAAIVFGNKDKIQKLALSLYDQYKGITETDAGLFDLLYKMWRHVGYSDVGAKSAIKNQTPWSAAFISWVMQKYPDFPKSASHSNYIVTARENYQAKKGNFWLRGPLAYKPKVGDILCMNRGGKRYTYQTIFRGAISHCDVVVEVHKDHIVTMGGNVSNQIKRNVVKTKNGYVDYREGYFAIIQNRHINK